MRTTPCLSGDWRCAILTLVIGTTTLFNLNLDNGRAELGYAMGSAYWGKGYMSEALRALVSHAFEVMNLRRLEADVDPRTLLRSARSRGWAFNVKVFFASDGT